MDTLTPIAIIEMLNEIADSLLKYDDCHAASELLDELRYELIDTLRIEVDDQNIPVY